MPDLTRASFIRRALLGVLAAPFAARAVCQPRSLSPEFTNLPGFPHQPVLPLRGFTRDVCMLDEGNWSGINWGDPHAPDITHYRLYRRA